MHTFNTNRHQHCFGGYSENMLRNKIKKKKIPKNIKSQQMIEKKKQMK